MSAVDRDNLNFAKHNASYKTICQIIVLIVEIVEEKLADCLPDKFGLLMDGGTTVFVHHCALFAV